MNTIENIISELQLDEHKRKNITEDLQRRPVTITGKDLLELKVVKTPKLLGNIFSQVGIIGFAGSSDVGKSTFVRNLAAAIVLGEKEFIGMELNARYRRALYVSSEDFEQDLAYLLQKLNNSYKKDSHSYDGLEFIINTEDHVQVLEQKLSENPVDLVVIDTFGDLYGKSMNESNQVRSFLNEYSQLAQKYKCLVIVMHHTGKRTEDFAPSKHNLLGSQGFESKMRLVIEFRRDKYDPSKKHFCIVKGNYLSSEYKDRSFVLRMDENFHFTNTGERVLFDELGGDDRSHSLELQKEIWKLKELGMTQAEIAAALNTNQTKVSRLLKGSN